jgi:hypothetical protein
VSVKRQVVSYSDDENEGEEVFSTLAVAEVDDDDDQ